MNKNKELKDVGITVASATVGTIVSSKVVEEVMENEEIQAFLSSDIDDVVCVYGPNPVLVESEELVSFDEDNIMLVDDTACVYGPDPVFIESEELVSFDKDDIMLVDDTDCVYGPDPYYMESSNRIDI